MPDLDALHAAAAAARLERDRLRADLRRDSLRLQEVDRELALAERKAGAREERPPGERPGHEREPEEGERRRVERLRREREALTRAVGERREALAAGRDRAIADIARLLADPETLVAQLEDRAPIVLFPVRIETKFGTGTRANTLLVRIFPDDVAVAHHEQELTAGEKEAGETYWRARATANAAAQADDRAKLQRGAWDLVASRFGTYRASWILKVTKPGNWTGTTADPASLAFPNVAIKPQGWSETPRCTVLPDRFAVVLQRGQASRTVYGGYIPDDLPLGPDPLQAESFFTRDAAGRLQVSDDLRWLIDFNRAVAVGMGLQIALSPEEAAGGFDRILVLGLRLSSPLAESTTALARLFESHRYSRGLAIVPQGAPTNNTQEAPSGLPTPADDLDEVYAVEQDASPFPLSPEPMRQTDGERLATALGLPIDLVRLLPHSRRLDVGESVAMHRALWGGTLGHFLAEMLQGSFTTADMSRVRLFFTEFVHGRGLVPAIRAGTQPYGIVVTSSFAGWTWHAREIGDDGDFWSRLQTELGHLREHWTGVAEREVMFVGRRDAQGQPLDPFKTLIHVIGQQASSVEYRSRTAVPETYVKALAAYRSNDPALVQNWVANARNTRTLELGNARIPVGSKATLREVLFFEGTDLVTSPVVDGDPAVPLSETRPIRPYNNALGHNYLHWLTTASSADLQNQRFLDADGKPVAAPTALLYKLLRVSTLAELNAGSRYIAARLRPEVFAQAPQMTVAANIAAPTLMPGHFTMVDTAKAGIAAQSMPTGDYLLGQARSATTVMQKPPEAAPLASLTGALTLLADLPTARLERLFAEHVDAVSYRLDAWLTALFARRLSALRASPGRDTGSYLGAYGWVEDVRPSTTRQPVSREQIAAELHPAIDGPVTRHADSGGFVHAPSLPHAVTAAVLRNAYLTHGEAGAADRMAVNLSSARVRTALRYIEGLQNGQELGALLGYQLERGLHEGHPGVELDAFIYVLRARFPLISKKLTPAPDGTPAEALEARHVVNGYDLLDFVKGKSYPYGLTDLPYPGAGPAELKQSQAITQEIDRLRDAMDAVADVLLAESVHQVVQGNYARARGSIQALTDGERPPVPDVVQTPRSGRALTHRVALFLTPGATGGWQPSPTPRAHANAALNHWLAGVLPAPATVHWMVTEGTAPPQFVSLDTLGLEPLDVVLMSGERLGDFSSLLERLLVYDYRDTHGVGDDVMTFAFGKTDPALPDAKALVFDPDRAPAGGRSLGSLLPMLKALRAIVTGSRALGARDLMRPTEAQDAHVENPQGHDGAAPPLKDLAELHARLEQAHASLEAEHLALKALIASMQPLAKALEDDDALAVQPAWTALLAQLRARLRAVLRYGIAEAMPSGGITLSRPLVSDQLTQAIAVAAILESKLTEARKQLDIAFTDPLPADPAEAARESGRRVGARHDAYASAARTLLGSDYVAIPLFAPHAESVAELNAAAASPAETDPLAVEGWLQSVARVRPAMQAWDRIAMYHSWLHDTAPAFVPMQLPVAPATGWIGGRFSTPPADDPVSIVATGAPAAFAAPALGLLVDEWTELVPAAEETTGLAIHVNRPNAVAPQAILVAVSPKQTGRWAWSDLVAILDDTLARAKLRAVEPDGIGYPYFQVLPPIVTAFNNSMLMPAAKFAGTAEIVQKA